MTQRFKILIFSHIPKFRYFIDLLHANVLLLIMLQHGYIEGYHESKITKSRNFFPPVTGMSTAWQLIICKNV